MRTEIENYLFSIYKGKTRMYKKIYYEKNKQRILDYNNKRYDDRLKKGITKFTEGEYIIKFN